MAQKRIILTFSTLHKVLAAEKHLRQSTTKFDCRTTPTPPGLSTSICGMALEILDHEHKKAVLEMLEQHSLAPEGVHVIE